MSMEQSPPFHLAFPVLDLAATVEQVSTTGDITNQYRLRILNKSQTALTFELGLESELPLELAGADVLTIEPGELLDQPLTLTSAGEAISRSSTRVTMTLCEVTGGACQQQRTSFLGPSP